MPDRFVSAIPSPAPRGSGSPRGPKQIYDHPNNEPDKISHPATASPDSRSTASQIEFATGTGIDLALGLIERDLGKQAAQRTARVLVVHHRRAGGQSQHSAMLQLDAKSDRVQIALAFAKQNLREPLTVELLAEAARLSPRQFSRVFRTETGLSPAKAIENLRLEAARFMLQQGRLPIEEIARETGFGDRERMRRSFLRTFGESPRALRNAAHPLATI